MTRSLKVAVSQRVDLWIDRGERRDALDQRVCQWLIQAGYLPIPVPNILNTSLNDWLQVVQPDAILLSGGNNLGEIFERDNTESNLLVYAKDRALPVLGICRGMQMMGVWSGASLKPAQNHVRARHQLKGDLTGEVNSFHEFALVECPSGFITIASAEDGNIEAIRHVELPWEGWMWHPERESTFNPQDLERVRTLFTGRVT